MRLPSYTQGRVNRCLLPEEFQEGPKAAGMRHSFKSQFKGSMDGGEVIGYRSWGKS